MTGPALPSDDLGKLRAWHAACRDAPLAVDMTRGLPSAEQIALSHAMLSLPGPAPFDSEDGQDWLNYGGQQGIPQLRALLAPLLLGVPAAQAAVGGNSSLALMHAAIGLAWRTGLPGHAPWAAAKQIRFLCPVPGYDRHFAICRDHGIAMVPVPMGVDGPDMDQVEERVAQDPMIRGMWCVPRHSNPCGATYSEEVLRRLATMKTAAADFTLFCDNAYDALDGADALVVVTEWKQFRSPDFVRLREMLNDAVVFDGRNLYDPQEIEAAGLAYYGIGRGRSLHA